MIDINSNEITAQCQAWLTVFNQQCYFESVFYSTDQVYFCVDFYA